MGAQMSKKLDLYLEFATDLMETCIKIYTDIPTGLAPEIVYFRTNTTDVYYNAKSFGAGDIVVKNDDAHSLLRPEAIESLFYFWRITKNERYRTIAWSIFQSFNNYSRVDTGGYASLDDVRSIPPPQRDRLDSFFLAETLKYLYLIFSDDKLLPLDEHIFNTEAHPFPVFK